MLFRSDGEKPTMGYLYEAMDRAKEAIPAYYEDKGDEGLEKQQVISRVIDDRWKIPSIAPFMLQVSTSTPHLLTPMVSDLMPR